PRACTPPSPGAPRGCARRSHRCWAERGAPAPRWFGGPAAAVGGPVAYHAAGRPAAAAGPVPVARDSGRETGGLHRPERYDRALRRVFFSSALSALKAEGPGPGFHRRERTEGPGHVRAVAAPARRRAGLLRAPLRNGRVSASAPPVPDAARPSGPPPASRRGPPSSLPVRAAPRGSAGPGERRPVRSAGAPRAPRPARWRSAAPAARGG